MKKYILLLIMGITLSCTQARSQSIGQLITQLVLDIQKLSELKSILNDMYKSYQIIDQGYNDIKGIAQGNFNLHKLFLDGLLSVSPTVKGYARIIDIIDAEASIVKEYKSAFNRFLADGHFTAQEIDYLGKQYSSLFSRSMRSVDELTMVITDNALRMSDAERLSSIDRIYRDITGDLTFLRSFNNSTAVQAIQRAKQAGDIATLKNLYGIN